MSYPKTKAGRLIAALLLILLPGGLVIAALVALLKKTRQAMTIYQTFQAVFKAKGMSAKMARWAYIQAGHETAGFTSRLFRDHNNIGGYTFRGQKGATKGRPLPENPTVFYAKYATVRDSIVELAGYYGRKSRQSGEPRHKVVDLLPTLSAFAVWLKNEGYYTDAAQNYARGLAHYERTLSYA